MTQPTPPPQARDEQGKTPTVADIEGQRATRQLTHVEAWDEMCRKARQLERESAALGQRITELEQDKARLEHLESLRAVSFGVPIGAPESMPRGRVVMTVGLPSRRKQYLAETKREAIDLSLGHIGSVEQLPGTDGDASRKPDETSGSVWPPIAFIPVERCEHGTPKGYLCTQCDSAPRRPEGTGGGR